MRPRATFGWPRRELRWPQGAAPQEQAAGGGGARWWQRSGGGFEAGSGLGASWERGEGGRVAGLEGGRPGVGAPRRAVHGSAHGGRQRFRAGLGSGEAAGELQWGAGKVAGFLIWSALGWRGGATASSELGGHGAGDISGHGRARALDLAQGGEEGKLELTWERMRTA